MLSIHAQQMGLILQGWSRKSQPKFLPSSPGTVGWEAHGTFLPISVAFWGAHLAAKTSEHLSEGFQKLPGVFPSVFCTMNYTGG